MKRAILFFFVLIGLIAVAYVFLGDSSLSISNFGNATSTQSQVSTGTTASKGAYTNKKYNFSVKLPEGFAARELAGTPEGDTILLENKNGDGIQIIISSFDNISVLTADMVKKDIPDLKMEQVQTIDVGQNYKGVAFLSDNPQFSGASRDVWFVFRGNLYQISTYARLDSLLQSVFSTWQFN